MLLKKIKALDSIPFHTPGHKRNTELLGNGLPYDIDITEIKDFDNLHSPEGILLKLNQKLNKLYGAKKSYALVNGSTVGVLSAVKAAAGEGDTVLIARNCHKSVYNALELAKAKAEYILPEYDEYGIAKGITAEQFKNKLNSKVKLIVITSPTYEGVDSEIDSICELAHKYNIPVLIDAAHGAHFFKKYHKADIVIRGLHKTLPALTQCAAANIYGDLIDTKRFEIILSMFETSSPSYVLLSSIEKCVDFVTQNNFDSYYENIKDFYNISLNNLKLLKYDDASKIVVFSGNTNITGYELADMLRGHNIEPEMAAADYVILLSTVCDKAESFNKLAQALKAIDKNLNRKEFISDVLSDLPPKYCEAFEIKNYDEAYDLTNCVNRVCAEYIWAYPPGIPLIVPGEIITKQLVEYIYSRDSSVFYSTYGCLPRKIYCKKFKY